jgi:hypothetical protein
MLAASHEAASYFTSEGHEEVSPQDHYLSLDRPQCPGNWGGRAFKTLPLEAK